MAHMIKILPIIIGEQFDNKNEGDMLEVEGKVEHSELVDFYPL